LIWNTTLEAYAQSISDRCVFAHSGGPYGENLAAGSGTGYTPADAITDWDNEESSYDPANPTYTHWTQVVWKSTAQLGCAVTFCADIFPTYGGAENYVCEYYPPGNFVGESAANVQK